MRRTALAVVILVVALCLFASGTERNTVKVYFTAGPEGSFGATQLWRCNRDGSEPELLIEGSSLWSVEVESSTEKLFYVQLDQLMVADLDGSNAMGFGIGEAYHPPALFGSHVFPVDVKDGYVCWASLGETIHTALADGSDAQQFDVSSIPDIVPTAVVADVGLHVAEGAPVESTTWGRIKAEFR